MKFCIIPMAGLAASALLCGSAVADERAHASLSGLQIQLVDLRPDDGIAPGVTFSGTDQLYSGSSSSDGWFYSVLGSSLFGELSYSNANSASSSSASLSTDPSSGTHTIKSDSYTIGNVVAGESGYYPNSGAGVIVDYAEFSLQPGTAMYITGLAEVQIGINPTTNTTGEGWAYISMSLNRTAHGGWPGDSSASLGDPFVTYADTDYSQSQSSALTVSFLNNGSAVETGNFNLQVGSLVEAKDGTIPVIPEPDRVALLLAGLGALEFCRRRTSARRQDHRVI